MVAGLRIFNKGLRFMDPQDETAKNAPEAIVQGLRNDRADPTGSEPKLSWEKGDILSISFDTEKGTESFKYKIEDELGTGGFAKTYKAMNQTNFQRFVLKFPLQAKWKIDPQFCIESFEAEAKALKPYKDIDHPNLVKFIALGHESASGMPAIVMNYIVGKTLEDQKGKISENQAITYIKQISSAVKLLHKDNNIHRDISPKNIIVRESDNQAVLLDLGISRSEGGQETSSGTPGFAPLEQTDHLNRVKPNKFHDVYALAVLLYWLVRGTHPTQDKRPSADILSQQTYKAIVFVTKLNKKNRMANRPTVDEFLKRLPSDFDSQTTQTTQTTKIEPVTKTEPEIQTIATTTEIPSVIPDRSPRFGFLAGVLKTIAITIVLTPLLAIPIVLVWVKSSIDPPVPLEISEYKDFNQTPFRVSYNPDLWQDQTQPLDRFRDNIVTHLVHRGNQPIDLSIEHFEIEHLETVSLEFKPPKAAIGIEEETITFLNQSVNTVTYQVTDKDSDRSVQVQQITLPLDQNVYYLFYEAPPDLFSRYEDEALTVFSSFDRSPAPLSPTSP